MSQHSQAFFISLVDLPFIESKDYNSLLENFLTTKRKLVRGRYQNQPTHPVLISSETRDEILNSKTNDQGCAFLFKKYPEQTMWLEMDSSRGLIDIDSMEDYHAHLPT